MIANVSPAEVLFFTIVFVGFLVSVYFAEMLREK